MSTPQGFLDAEQAADLLGREHISPYTLLQRARRKEIPHRRFGRRIFWTVEDIEQIKTNAYVPPAPRIAQSAGSRARNHKTA